ncbi:MFS transporter [Streptomonospora sp. S1-112]|uniref:MFS transporter n=1 Tax=Streptomonospora mangrovi TaxID=2883123 RepID=A0A9X3NGR8_9ACTN|nr:MFS transporter [Streptomonospora mangrovi]MDA0563419.1 MFS transporter [Streptomonospora mangrovi]
MPRAVHILALGIFAMVTSEFAVAGLMPHIARDLDATIPQIGYLITVFALAMALGGPLLTLALLRLRPRTALLALFALFLTGNILAATATDYTTMAAARIITGAASQAFFGAALSLGGQLAPTHLRGRAIAHILNGLMLGTLLGLPAATLIGEHHGWRAAFWAISALTLAAATATLALVPNGQTTTPPGGLRTELRALTRPRLWLALATSTLIIGATFSAFSYLTPILTQATGLAPATVPWLLAAYGAATVIGNTVVGRLADRHTLPVLLTGLAANTAFLTAFALLAHHPIPAVTAMLGIGLVGVTMNPAMVTRVQRTANDRPLITTVHSSFITLGVIIGSAAGGLAITTHGLTGPLWLGAALALTGIATLIPDLTRPTTTPPTTASAPAPR